MKYDFDKIICGVAEESFRYEVNIQKTDKSSKELFERKGQFIELIRSFIKEPWVNLITEKNIELVDKEFITSSYTERTADILYRIKLGEEELYFFLLEIQSSVDSKMPYRLLEYMFETWRKYKENGKLPIVIPCILYTGKSKWNVKDFRSMFNEREEFQKYIPNFEYILIDVNRYSDEELERIGNLVSSVFFLTKSKDTLDVIDRIKRIKELNKKDRKALMSWCRCMFIDKKEVRKYIKENLKEEKRMGLGFAEFVPEIIEMWKSQGRVESISKLLSRKFKNEITDEIKEKINNVSTEKLDEIEDKIFEITSIHEVLEILD